MSKKSKVNHQVNQVIDQSVSSSTVNLIVWLTNQVQKKWPLENDLWRNLLDKTLNPFSACFLGLLSVNLIHYLIECFFFFRRWHHEQCNQCSRTVRGQQLFGRRWGRFSRLQQLVGRSWSQWYGTDQCGIGQSRTTTVGTQTSVIRCPWMMLFFTFILHNFDLT